MNVHWRCPLTKKEKIDIYLLGYLQNNKIENKELVNIDIINSINQLLKRYKKHNGCMINTYIIKNTDINRLIYLRKDIYRNVRVDCIDRCISIVS